jgi:acyl carrier protein
MAKDNLNKVIQLVSKNTGIPSKDISIDSKSDDFDKWDSFAHVKIILEIENITNKSISPGRIGNINSIRSILSLLS